MNLFEIWNFFRSQKSESFHKHVDLKRKVGFLCAIHSQHYHRHPYHYLTAFPTSCCLRNFDIIKVWIVHWHLLQCHHHIHSPFISWLWLLRHRAHRALKYWASLWLPVHVVFVARFLNQNNSRFFNEIVVLATSSCNQRWREKQNMKTKPTGLISKIKQSAFEVHFLADSFAITARLTLSNFIGMAMRSSLSSTLSRRDYDFIWNTDRAAQYSRTLPYC